jgi:superoxide dismutase, Cu-Zn family
MISIRTYRVTAVIVLVAGMGCHRQIETGTAAGVTAELRTGSGASVGTLRFGSSQQGIRITGTLNGLTPGAHGIHLHTVGRCDAADFATAGGHFNPTGAQHGMQNAMGPHAGDLPGITANAAGQAAVDISNTRTTIAALLDADGTAIVVHAAADDQRTDPSGNSGARVACGVLKTG